MFADGCTWEWQVAQVILLCTLVQVTSSPISNKNMLYSFWVNTDGSFFQSLEKKDRKTERKKERKEKGKYIKIKWGCLSLTPVDYTTSSLTIHIRTRNRFIFYFFFLSFFKSFFILKRWIFDTWKELTGKERKNQKLNFFPSSLDNGKLWQQRS